MLGIDDPEAFMIPPSPCHLHVVGTGITPDGDPTSDYSGTCIQRGNLRS